MHHGRQMVGSHSSSQLLKKRSGEAPQNLLWEARSADTLFEM